MSQLSDFYFNEEKEVICGKEVPSIVNDYISNNPSVVERFFTKFYYKKNVQTNDEDHLVLFHSNRICLIQLAPTHIALRKGIRSINFNIGNIDRSQNHCSGKGKKGAMNLQPTSTLAIVTCMDDTEYKIVSCVMAKLIEVNERTVQRPELLSIEGDGYVAICLPKPEHCENNKLNLLTEKQYNDFIEK